MNHNPYTSAALPSSKTIADLYTSVKNGSLEVRPDFQRKLVWNIKHKIKFIDTILNNFPFPEIYIANSPIKSDSIAPMQIVVDGQQRLTAIFEYIDDKLRIPASSPITKFTDLNEDEKQIFLNYPVTVRHLVGMDEERIKEVFKRINQTQYALNLFEVTHAVYAGEFISTAKKICETPQFKNLPTFRESEISRMSDLGFVLLLMSTIEHQGYFSGDKEVERYVKEFDSEYPQSHEIYESFINTIDSINKLSLPDDSIWFRKSNLFTLLVESVRQKQLPPQSRLLDFEDKITQAKNSERMANVDSEYVEYYSAMYTGTNSRQARTLRARIFNKYMF